MNKEEFQKLREQHAGVSVAVLQKFRAEAKQAIEDLKAYGLDQAELERVREM